MKKIMFISVLVAIFTACNNKEKDLVIENKETIETVSNKVLEKFAKTLAVVLQENRESRELIKKKH